MVKKLHINPPVLPAQGIEILQLCKGLQELTLDIVIDSTYDRSRLYGSLNTLRITTLSMNLTSSLCGPTIFLPDLLLLHRIKRLHLTNTWVSQCGLFIGLQELCQLTHLSFHVCPPGELLHIEVLFEILNHFWRLRAVILWWMEYQESEKIYNHLNEQDLMDRRIVVFNTVSRTKHIWYSEHGMYCRFEIILERVMSATHIAVIPRTRTSPAYEEEFTKMDYSDVRNGYGMS